MGTDHDRQDSERLVRVETILKDLHNRLFGNGQSGVIDKLDTRVTRLERVTWRGLGFLFAVALVMNVLTGSGWISLSRFVGK